MKSLKGYRKLEPGVFVISTQAGFMQAVHEVWGENPDDCEVYGMPIEYPSLVTITVAYAGYFYVRCYPIHVPYLLEQLNSKGVL